MSGSGRRWVDWVVLSGSSVVICLLLHGVFEFVGGLVQRFVAKWPSWFSYGFAAIVSALYSIMLCRIRALGAGHFTRSIIRYPPTWAAGLAAAALYFVIVSIASPLGQRIRIEFPIAVCAFAFAGMGGAIPVLGWSLWRYVRRDDARRTSEPATGGDTIEAMLEDPGAIDRWLRNEEPISCPQEDMFGLARVARRVARLLLEREPKTVGIVGPFGCGKTSLLNLVQYYLERPEKIAGEASEQPVQSSGKRDHAHVLVCRAAGWGVREGAVPDLILSAVVDALATRIDCLPIYMLPRQYRAALSQVGTAWTSILAGILTLCGKAEDALRSLDRILEAIRCSLVVFVEDIERNPEPAAETELCALLDRLRELKHVSFVLATSRPAPTALPRICERIETVPRLPFSQVIAIARVFRDWLMRENGDMLVLPEETRNLLWTSLAEHDDIFAADGLLPAGKAFAHLLDTPRHLKTALRRTYHAWDALHGEIDFDTLLICTALRHAAPEVYGFVLQNISGLRGQESGSPSGSRNKAAKKLLEEELERATANVAFDAGEARKLVASLFPHFDADVIKRVGERPQSLAVSSPTDYWHRLHAEEIPAGELQDKTVLRAVGEWRRDNDARVADQGNKTLPRLLSESEGWREKVSQFWEYVGLDPEKVQALRSQVFSAMLDASDNGRRLTVRQGTSLALILAQKDGARQGLKTLSDPQVAPSLLPEWSGVPAAAPSRSAKTHKLRDLLLSAARSQKMQADLARLLTETRLANANGEPDKWRHELRTTTIEALLGSRAREVMEILAEDFDGRGNDSQTQEIHHAAQEAAREWLRRHQHGNRPTDEAGGSNKGNRIGP